MGARPRDILTQFLAEATILSLLGGLAGIALGVTGGLALTYGDTIGDLVLSSTGGLVGSWIGVRWLGPVVTRRGR